MRDGIGEQAGDQAAANADQHTGGEFLGNEAAQVGAGDLAQGQCTDNQRHGLVAGVAADAGHDRHQKRQHHDLAHGALEARCHVACHPGRGQIEQQPRRAVFDRARNRREDVFLLAQAGLGQHLFFLRVADEVHHLIHRHAPDQLVVGIDHRR